MIPGIIKSLITSVIDFDLALNEQSRRSYRDYNAIYSARLTASSRNLVRGMKREIISEPSSQGIMLYRALCNACPPHHRPLWRLQFSGLSATFYSAAVFPQMETGQVVLGELWV